MKLGIEKLYNVLYMCILFKIENYIKRGIIITKVLPYDSSAEDGQAILRSLVEDGLAILRSLAVN
jgi:hypothetical protein